MSAIMKSLAGGAFAAAALVSAAPASAQYYPGYGSPYGYGNGGVVGQVLGQVLGGGYGYNNGYGGYGANSQAAVSQCVNAVQARLSGGYGGYGAYGGYNNGYSPYGNGGYGQARVLGISRVEPRSNGGLTVRGVASSGRYGAYAYGGAYGGQAPADLTFKCKTDYRGFVTDVDVNRAQSNYGSNYTPYNYDYSQYGYRRY